MQFFKKIFNKKNSIWIIIFLMVMAFSLLISLQFGYVIRTKNIITRQYADAGQRSLYRTVKSVEEAEVLTYIDESFKNDTPEARKAKEAIKKAADNGIDVVLASRKNN